jgi:hypothetical protein
MTRASARTGRRVPPAAVAAIALAGAWCVLAPAPARASVNSYRFLHVTIDTPWYIFLFLLMGIFAPFVLMVVLMWRNSTRKRELARENARPPGGGPARVPPPQAPPPPQP